MDKDMKRSMNKAKERKSKAGFIQLIFSTRFLMTILVMLGVFCQYAAKLDLSVNIVFMVTDHNTSSNDTNLDWSHSMQQNLLAAFFYGYLISEIPGGMMAQRFGSKWTMAFGIGLSSICAWLYGTAAEFSFVFMFASRVLVGFGSGVILPSVSNVWTSWAPQSERSFLISMATSGAHLAPIVIFNIGGYLEEHGFTSVKWKSLFYVVAIMETIWLVLWFILFADSPRKSRIISQEEIRYIEENIETGPITKHDLNAPWKSIFTSRACIALFLCHTCANWAFYTLLVEAPTFFKKTFNPDAQETSLFSSLPYVVILISTTISSFLADYLLKRRIVTSRTLIRKVAVGLGTFLPGAFLIGLALSVHSQSASVACLTLGQGLFGIAWGAGHMCNANDLAPVHAGIVFGISNTLATIPGVITPYVTHALIGDNNSLKGWQIVFGISSVFMFLAGTVFVGFGSGMAQEWDSDSERQHHIRGSICSFH